MDDDSITAVKAGILKHNAVGNRWWVESNQRRVGFFTLFSWPRLQTSFLVCLIGVFWFDMINTYTQFFVLNFLAMYSMWQHKESQLLEWLLESLQSITRSTLELLSQHCWVSWPLRVPPSATSPITTYVLSVVSPNNIERQAIYVEWHYLCCIAPQMTFLKLTSNFLHFWTNV